MELGDTNNVPQVSASKKGNLTVESDQMQAPVVGAGLMDFGGGQSRTHRSLGGKSVSGVGHVAPVTIKKTGDKLKNLLQSWEKINSQEEEEIRVLDALEDRIHSMNKIVAGAKNIHKSVKADMVVALRHLKRLENIRAAIKVEKQSFRHEMETATKEIAEVHMAMAPSQGQGCDVETSQTTPKVRGDRRVSTSPDVIKMGKREHARKDATNESNKKEESERGQKPPTENDWEEVRHRKNKRKKDKKEGNIEENMKRKKKVDRKRTDAIKITAKEGISYSDILMQMKSSVNPDESGAEVKKIRRTRKGELLLELMKEDEGDKFKQAIMTALQEKAEVKTMMNLKQVEIRDLDETVSEEDVAIAIKNILNDREVNVGCKLWKGYGNTQLAVIQLPAKLADIFCSQEKVKIGWVNCRIRERVEIVQCYRCLGYGHISTACKGPDRMGLCWICGKDGHKAKECSEQDHCILCEGKGDAETNHRMGSRKCPSFQAEWKRRRKC